MSFHLSQTPTLEAVSTDDEQLLSQDLQARVAEAVAQAHAQPEVAAAIELARATTEELTRLRSAERALHQLAKDSRAKLEQIGQQALDALVDAAAGGGSPEWKKASEAAAIEDQIRYAGRAIERLAEHSIPLAHIASLREEAHSLEAQSRALEAIAEERAKKVLAQIRGAVSDEMVLPVDFSKGVAGALIARAKEWRYRGVQMAAEADELEQSYRDRT
jgi:hypothetical protein